MAARQAEAHATVDLNLAHWAMEMNQTLVALHPLSALCSVMVQNRQLKQAFSSEIQKVQ